MHIQRVDAAGSLVGPSVRVGPASPSTLPLWSPLGRYLVWRFRPAFAARGVEPKIELYDTTTKTLHSLPDLNNADVGSTGVGVQIVRQGNTTVTDKLYDANHHPTSSGSATFSHLMSVAAAGHTQAIVETGTFSGDGKPATFWQLPASGPPLKVGVVAPLHFLGQDQAPAVNWVASTNDGTTTAIVTGLGQDGGCANGQDVHLIDLVHHTDTVIALPLSRGDLLAPTFSPGGNVLGGISADCGYEGNDKSNAFVELHGSTWKTVVVGATVASRGPGGLLAVQLGTFHAKEYEPVPSQDHPLEIRNAAGVKVSTLPSCWSVAWTQAAVPPA
ncbi:MAG: hypothetical protein JO222_08210 [Frankiales bacterium]|nr:hypothetical protein [Frankiales bacterium]